MRGVWCVYEHVFPNGYVYVGKTGVDPKERWSNGFGYSGQSKVFSLIVKYGWDNIEHNILADNLSEEEATELEAKTIKDMSLKSEVANTYLVSKKTEIKETDFKCFSDEWEDIYIERLGKRPFGTSLLPNERVVDFQFFQRNEQGKIVETHYLIKYPEDIDTSEKLCTWLRQGQPGEWVKTA